MKYDRKIRPKKKNRKKKLLSLILIIVAILYVIPIIFTICNSFMAESEIAANYGKIFESVTGKGSSRYISETVHLKFIPDMVSFKQYFTVLFNSPDYLLKFWNSVILVIPIVIFQMGVALLASYGFARYRGRLREIIFFAYIILMLMPYQVTLVPNFFVSEWLGIIDSNWAIWLPGIFSPFAVFLLTKCMRRIPVGIIEAAKIDGAGEFKIFTQICIPLCKSAIASVCILLFIDYWNMVEQPLVLLTDTAKQPLSVFLSQINEPELGIAFAASSVYMIPPLLIFFWGEDYLVEGISRSGIK